MGSPCNSNVTHWSKDPVTSNDQVLKKHISEIRNALKKEYQRRGLSVPNDLNANDLVLIERNHVSKLIDHAEELRNYDQNHNVHPMYSFTWHDKNLSDNIVKDVHINDLHTNVNKIERACLCNCDYCTCNCNYCTCDCNYCTCNCNYCTCNCNYSCTCNCNYSCTCNCNYSCTCNCNYCTCDCNYCTCNCNYSCTCNCNY